MVSRRTSVWHGVKLGKKTFGQAGNIKRTLALTPPDKFEHARLGRKVSRLLAVKTLNTNNVQMFVEINCGIN